jgi:hypothetical protein
MFDGPRDPLIFLNRIHAAINQPQKWAISTPVIIPGAPAYEAIHQHISELSPLPLPSAPGEPYIDPYKIVAIALSQVPLDYPLVLSMIVTDHYNCTGIRMEWHSDCDITYPFLAQLVSTLVGQEILPENTKRTPEFGTTIELERNHQRCSFSIDLENMKVVGFTLSESKSIFPVISLKIFCDFASIFQSFALKTLIAMLYRPNTTFTCSLGLECLLINIPKSSDRFQHLANFLFPSSTCFRHSSHCESDTLDIAVDVTLICATGTERQGELLTFCFTDGNPEPANSYSVIEMLSSIVWTDHNLSFVPGEINGVEEIPFCTVSKATSRTPVLALFVNSFGADSLSIRVKAVDEVFRSMSRQIPNLSRKSNCKKRLNCIWRHFSVISESMTSIIGEDLDPSVIWNSCCRLTMQHSRPMKKDKAVRENELRDNFKEMISLTFDGIVSNC